MMLALPFLLTDLLASLYFSATLKVGQVITRYKGATAERSMRLILN